MATTTNPIHCPRCDHLTSAHAADGCHIMTNGAAEPVCPCSVPGSWDPCEGRGAAWCPGPCPHDRVAPLRTGGFQCLDCAETFVTVAELDEPPTRAYRESLAAMRAKVFGELAR